MTKSLYCTIAILLIASSATRLSAQYTGPSAYNGLIKLPIAIPSAYPPIHRDMPFDVMLGYVYLDSLVRSVNIPSGQCDSLLSTVGWDTMKYALKYLYRMTEDDASTFFQELELEPNVPAYKWTSTPFVFESILRRAGALAQDRIIPNLVSTAAILQVHVTDTQTVIDPNVGPLNKMLFVTCTIQDTIKGKHLPWDNVSRSVDSQSLINFEYWLWWQRNIKSSNFVWDPESQNNLIDSLPWVKRGRDYIVFLNFSNLGLDSAKTHALISVNPGFGPSSVIGIYPIEDGRVVDPNNDFGFGTALTTSQFKTALRQKIQTILSY